MPDYQHFYEFEVGVQNVKYRGSQGKGRCPLGTHSDQKPSFSFNIDTGQCTCFSCHYKGNAYMIAKELNLENPERMINDVPLQKNGHIPPKKRELDLSQVEIHHQNLGTELLERVPRMGLMKMGVNDRGLVTFPYIDASNKITGIKTHKAAWDGDGTCRIYGENLLKDYSKDRLMICEGEPDMLVCPMNAVSFSAGAGSIPKDLTPILDFKTIYICYDNDQPGVQGAEKVATAIKKQSKDIKVMICQWSDYLDDGYDVKDDYAKSKDGYFFDEFDLAVKNAVEFKLPSNGYEIFDSNYIMDTYTQPPKAICQYLLYEDGISLISGTDGVGKTWFVLQMAHAIATGTDFLDFPVAQRDVLLIQFELSQEQLSSRLKLMQKNFEYTDRLKIALHNDEDMLFTDQWEKIKDSIHDMNLRNGVVFVDNIYTSTGKKISDNHELQSILASIQHIKSTTGNSIVLVGHHNKSTSDEEPILTKGLIHGGKHLTNFVHNVFQIGESTLGVDLRRGKITKVRDEHCDLNGEPFKLTWDREKCLFERGAVIPNEKLHCLEASDKWEIATIKDFYEWNNHKEFDRTRIWTFLESQKGWMPSTYNINNKLTRYLSTMTKWNYLIKTKHGFYDFNHDEITI